MDWYGDGAGLDWVRICEVAEGRSTKLDGSWAEGLGRYLSIYSGFFAAAVEEYHHQVIPSYTTFLTAGHTESSFLFLTVSNTYELIHTRILSRHTQDGTHIISRFINLRLISLLINIVKQVTNLDKRTHGQAKQGM